MLNQRLSFFGKSVNSYIYPQIRHKAAIVKAKQATYTIAIPTDSFHKESDQIPKQNDDQMNDLMKPGAQDKLNFKVDETVLYWQDRRRKEGVKLSSSDGIIKFANFVYMNLLEARIFRDQESFQYWAYHVARTAYFVSLGIVSYTNVRTSRSVEETKDSTPPGSMYSKQADLLKLLENVLLGPVTEAMYSYRQDLENIRAGLYKLPWDMVTSENRQFNPRFVLRSAQKSISEATNVLGRRLAAKQEPLWFTSNMYPNYYQDTFHYQTDGWMSSESAKVYESSTEMIFFGRQDVMQRHALVPFKRWYEKQSKSTQELAALEVAAGTGRFATFFKDNYPNVNLTISDLSPFYLEEARNNLVRWLEMRNQGQDFGGYLGTGTTFIQTAAENLAVDDESQDIVFCTYLFHELPPKVRNQVMKEFARVLRPGGILILADSIQLGDRPQMDNSIGSFESFNEPYYKSYIEYDFGKALKEVGLKCDMKVSCSVTKVLSALKPLY